MMLGTSQQDSVSPGSSNIHIERERERDFGILVGVVKFMH